MVNRWLFTERANTLRRGWTWQLLKDDGSILKESAEFANYGEAVHDAIINGFHPIQDHWVIESKHCVTHYEQGEKPTIAHFKTPASAAPLHPRTKKPRDTH